MMMTMMMTTATTVKRARPARWPLVPVAGFIFAATMPGLAGGAAGTPLEIELARGSLATADFGDARLSGTENRIAIRGPSMPAGENEFRWALDYAYQRYEYVDLPTRDRDLHRLELPLRWLGGRGWRWDLEMEPVIAASSNIFKEIWSRGTSDDLMLNGRAGISPAGNDGHWNWRAGIAYDDAFGRRTLYPELSVVWRGGALGAQLGWPSSSLSWYPGRMELGAAIAPAGARWHVVSDERDGSDFDYVLRAWRADTSVRWHGSESLSVTARAGVEFERRHRLEDDDGALVDRPAQDALFAEIVLDYRW